MYMYDVAIYIFGKFLQIDLFPFQGQSLSINNYHIWAQRPLPIINSKWSSANISITVFALSMCITNSFLKFTKFDIKSLYFLTFWKMYILEIIVYWAFRHILFFVIFTIVVWTVTLNQNINKRGTAQSNRRQHFEIFYKFSKILYLKQFRFDI